MISPGIREENFIAGRPLFIFPGQVIEGGRYPGEWYMLEFLLPMVEEEGEL